MITEKYKYFRETRLWPLSRNLNYEQWLENFNGNDVEIAKLILDFFIYIPDSFIDQMLSTVIGKCGYYFKQQRSTWTNEDFENNCWYSFMPGEELKSTDSGYVFNRKLRDILGIPEKRILNFTELREKLRNSRSQNVILVDDFVGSGHQTCYTWNHHGLRKICQRNQHKIIYAPLIVNNIGYHSIQSECDGLSIEFIHLLNNQYSLFNENCPCWRNDEALFHKAIDLILDKSKTLGIPLDDDCVNGARGYKGQGLAIAFEHGMPDACLPIFYWETKHWKPLMKKTYSNKYSKIIL